MRKLAYIIVVVLLLAGSTLGVKKAHAASLLNASASASTSRPSPSAPLNSPDPLNAGSSQVTVIDNLSTFLASDTAKFFKNGAYSETDNIATTSANRTTLNFTAGTANLQNKTSVIAVPITAMHTIAFMTQTAIPSGGKIVITYPNTAASDTNGASPSASTWMFNGLTSGNIMTKVGVGAGAASISSCTPSQALTGNATSTITCTTTGATIGSGVPIWIFIGCSAINSVPSCSTPVPTLINPTNANTRGSGNTYALTVQTQDASSVPLDTSNLRINTVESVFVVAHVDPTFTFSIAGVGGGTSMHTTSTCGTTFASISTNNAQTQQGAQPTEVNLGTIQNASDTYEAQKLTISSNTSAGYAITATSSGNFMNPATGVIIPNTQGATTGNNTPAPVANNSSNGGFGIHPCDAQTYANTHVLTQWYSGGSKGNPLFANPSSTFYYTLVNWTGPLGNENTITAGRDVIYSLYWAAPQPNTAPGDYWEIMTYNASATF